MAGNIEEIMSNCFYYADSLIYNFNQPDGADDLIEVKQIRSQMQVLIVNLNDTCLDKELHLNKMHELETQFLKVIKKRSFMNMCIKLKSLTMERSKYESDETMKYKIYDLITDIEEFYETFIPSIEKNLVCLDTSNLLNPDFNLEYTMNFVLDETKLAIDLLDDLGERIVFILQPIEPTSTNILINRARPQKRAYLIAHIAEGIVKKFEMQCGSRKHILEMARLYKRMSTLLAEAKFLEFSPRDAKRYEIFEAISKYQDVLHRECRGFYDYEEIVRQLRRLKRDIAMESRQYLLTLAQDDQFFKYTMLGSKLNIVVYIKKIARLFTTISNAFDTYAKRFEMIRKLMDEAWNTKYQLKSS